MTRMKRDMGTVEEASGRLGNTHLGRARRRETEFALAGPGSRSYWKLNAPGRGEREQNESYEGDMVVFDIMRSRFPPGVLSMCPKI